MKRNQFLSSRLICGSALGLAVFLGAPFAAQGAASLPPPPSHETSPDVLRLPSRVALDWPQERPQEPASNLPPVDFLSIDSIFVDTIPVALVEARMALDSVAVLTDTVLSMVRQAASASIADQQVIRIRAAEPIMDMTRLLEGISAFLVTASDSAPGVAEVRERVAEGVDWAWSFLEGLAQDHRQALGWINERRLEEPLESRGPIHAEIQDRSERLTRIMEFQLRLLVLSDSAGLDLVNRPEVFDATLLERAPNLAGQIEVAVEDQDRAHRVIRRAERGRVEGDARAQAALALEEATNWTRILAEDLTNTADLMDERGQETAEYRQLVISATGAVSGDILDFDVMWGLVLDYVMSAASWFQEEAGDVGLRFLIVMVAIMTLKYLFKVVWWVLIRVRIVGKTKATKALGARLVSPFGSISGLLLGLYLIGVAPTFLAAGVGVVGVILGLALQDSVSNLAAGVFVLLRTPYDLDHIVVLGGVLGRVVEVGLSTTSLKTFDNRVVHVPNRKVLADVMDNRSVQPIRRVEAQVSVAYEDNLDRIAPSVLEMLMEAEKVLADPVPEVFVSKLADSGAELTVFCWTPTETWWDVETELPGLLWSHFQKTGIEIPYPRRQVISGERMGLGGKDSSSDPPPE